MARNNQTSRRWDGKPETKSDKKFFDLRDSGYNGPIDQDGNKVTSGRDFEILQDLARRNAKHRNS